MASIEATKIILGEIDKGFRAGQKAQEQVALQNFRMANLNLQALSQGIQANRDGTITQAPEGLRQAALRSKVQRTAALDPRVNVAPEGDRLVRAPTTPGTPEAVAEEKGKVSLDLLKGRLVLLEGKVQEEALKGEEGLKGLKPSQALNMISIWKNAIDSPGTTDEEAGDLNRSIVELAKFLSKRFKFQVPGITGEEPVTTKTPTSKATTAGQAKTTEPKEIPGAVLSLETRPPITELPGGVKFNVKDDDLQGAINLIKEGKSKLAVQTFLINEFGATDDDLNALDAKLEEGK